ncbi:MAG: hypothetical protein EBT15_04155 [Betaproteobacteria bacterium]|nr:hypothetical protein [Betaproteobacteria bacterium]
MSRNYDYNGDPCGEFGAALQEVEKLRTDLARFRLTDEEREAIAWSIDDCVATAGLANDKATIEAADKHAATLRGLLKRLGGAQCTS